MADVQLAVIDEENTQVVIAVPGIQGPTGATGSVSTLASGTAAVPSLAFTGDTDTGLFSPGANQLSATTSGTERLRIDATGQIEISALGTAAAPALSWIGDPNTGIYSPGADQLAISTNGTGRLFVASDGKVSLGAAAFAKTFNVIAADASINLRANSGGTYSDHGIFFAVDGTAYSHIYNDGPGHLIFRTGAGLSERLRIDSSGRLLVGTSSSVALLGYNSGTQFAASTGTVSLIRNTTDNGATEIVYAKSRGTISAPTIVSDGDGLSLQRFAGYDGAAYIEAARVSAAVDGTPGLNDMPGRLVFSTTADGASSPTERMRISNDGAVKIAGDNFQIATSKTPASATATGTTGQIAWDASYIYVCTATNTWKRAALSTW
jgi:hypothetical protein